MKEKYYEVRVVHGKTEKEVYEVDWRMQERDKLLVNKENMLVTEV